MRKRFPAGESFVPLTSTFKGGNSIKDCRLPARHQTAALPAATGGDDLLMVVVQPERCWWRPYCRTRLFEGDDGKFVYSRSRVLRPPPRALARSFSKRRTSRRSIRRDPARSRPRPPKAPTSFWASLQILNRSFPQQRKNAARAPRFPLLQSSAQRLYSVLLALPGAAKS